MQTDDLIRRFSGTAEDRQKAIFSTLFIAGNRLQTLFDRRIPGVTLKQFMLLSLARQAEGPCTLTQLGELLGCSRQNVRKLAEALQRKGFVTLRPGPSDPRALWICPTDRAEAYFRDDFSRYQRELGRLFEVYTDEEVETLFRLMSRLYAGIDRLAQCAEEESE